VKSQTDAYTLRHMQRHNTLTSPPTRAHPDMVTHRHMLMHMCPHWSESLNVKWPTENI